MSSNAIGQRPKERTARTPKAKNRTHPRLEKFVKDFLLHPVPTTTPKEAVTNNYDNDACQNTGSDLIDNINNGCQGKDDTTSRDSVQSAATAQADKRPASPLTNQCPICLANIKTEDTSFTNTCFHSFCYTCIDEWTKVKTQCPVCRTDFTKIIYKVKSETVYEEKLARAPRRPESLFSSSRSFMNDFRIELNAPQDHQSGNGYHYSVQLPIEQIGGFHQSLLQSMLDIDPRPHSSHRSRNADRHSGMYSQNHSNYSNSVQVSHPTSNRVNASTNTPSANINESRRRHSSRVSSMRVRAHSNTSTSQEPRLDNLHVSRDPRLDNHNYAEIAFNRQLRERLAILEDTMAGQESTARMRHYQNRLNVAPGFRSCSGQASSSNSNVRRSTRTRSRTQASAQHICTPTDILNNRQSSLGGFGHTGEYIHSGESRINNLHVQHSSLYTDRFNDYYQSNAPHNERDPLLLSNPILLSQLTETIPQDMVNRAPYMERSTSSSRPDDLHSTSVGLNSSISGNPSASLISAISLNGLLHSPYNRQTSSYIQVTNDFTMPPPLEDISLNIPPIVAHRTSTRASPPPLLDSQDHVSIPTHSSGTSSRNQVLNMAHQRVRSSNYSVNYPQLYQQSASPSFHPNWQGFLTSSQNFNQTELSVIPSRIEEANSVRAHDRQSTLDRQSSSRQGCSFWSGPPRIVSNRYRSNKKQRTSVACRPVEFINLSGSEDEDDSNSRRETERTRNETASNSRSSVAFVQLDNPQPSTSGTQTTERRNSKRKKATTFCRNAPNSSSTCGESSSRINLRPDNIGSRLSSPENDRDNELLTDYCHHVNNPTLSRTTAGYKSDDSSEVEIVDCLKPISERDHDVIDLEDD